MEGEWDREVVDLGIKRLEILTHPAAKQSTGWVLWEAGTVLGRYLQTQQRSLNLHGKRCLEIGAGCGGIPGIVLYLLGAGHVILTDQHQALVLLRKNLVNHNIANSILGNGGIETTACASSNSISSDETNVSNKEATTKTSGSSASGSSSKQILQLEEYHFGEDPPESLKSFVPFDIIVGTDILYKKDLVLPVLASLRKLAGRSTVIFLAYELRCEFTHEFFLKEAAKDFTLKKIPKAKLGGGEDSEFVLVYCLRRKGGSAREQSS